MRRKKNLKQLLNLSVLDCTNRNIKVGDLDMPYLTCSVVPDVDYLASYRFPSMYHYTDNTCVEFFDYDSHFDGLHGLWNGIYYGIADIQDYYRKRFETVRLFISPDYSKCGDVPLVENLYRQYKSRIVSNWLTLNTSAVVIPLVSCPLVSYLPFALDGMQDARTVAFSTTGALAEKEQLKILQISVEYAISRLPELREIVVNTTSPDVAKVRQLFKSATAKGIRIEIPLNTLMQRHIALRNGEADGDNE